MVGSHDNWVSHIRCFSCINDTRVQLRYRKSDSTLSRFVHSQQHNANSFQVNFPILIPVISVSNRIILLIN